MKVRQVMALIEKVELAFKDSHSRLGASFLAAVHGLEARQDALEKRLAALEKPEAK